MAKRSADGIWMTNSSTARAPAGEHAGKLTQMLGAARGHAVGKFGEPRLAHQVDVLDLEIARPPRRVVEQEIDAGVLAVFHLAPDGRIIAQFRDQAGLERFGDQLVRLGDIHADELRPAAQIGFDQFPGMRIFSQRIAGIGQPYPRKWPVEAGHGARIGDVNRHHLAGGEHHIGKKALIAARQRCLDERRAEIA